MPEVPELAAIETLLKAATPEAAASLQSLAESAADKETRKAAKRALYRLSQQGVAVVRAPKAPPPAPKADTTGILHAYASNFDGAGDRLLWFILPDPDGGSPTLFSVMLRDDFGVRDIILAKQGRRELDTRFKSIEAEITRGLALAEIEPDYGRWLLQEAREMNRRTLKQTPAGFLETAPRVGTTTQTYEPHPVYARLTPEAVLADTEYPRDAAALFALVWFENWFLEMERMYPALGRWMAANFENMERSEEEKQERSDAALRESTHELMTAEMLATYKARLEGSADILHRRGETQAALQALYHALNLTEGEAADSDFARALVERSVQATREMMMQNIARNYTPSADADAPDL